jgi:hypothetical protein
VDQHEDASCVQRAHIGRGDRPIQSGVDEQLLKSPVRRDARSLLPRPVGRDGVEIDVAERAAALLLGVTGERAHRRAAGAYGVGERADGQGVGGRRAGPGADRLIARVFGGGAHDQLDTGFWDAGGHEPLDGVLGLVC